MKEESIFLIDNAHKPKRSAMIITVKKIPTYRSILKNIPRNLSDLSDKTLQRTYAKCYVVVMLQFRDHHLTEAQTYKLTGSKSICAIGYVFDGCKLYMEILRKELEKRDLYKDICIFNETRINLEYK